MGQPISEETGKALITEMKNLVSEMATFNGLFCYMEKKKKVQKEIKEKSKKIMEALERQHNGEK